MSFFYDTRGDSYPISRIKRIIESASRQTAAKLTYVKVELDDESVVEVYDSAVNRIRVASGPILSAEPGTFVLHYSEDHEGSYVGKDPVVGWSTGNEGCAMPILVDAEFEGMRGNMAYLFPDGKIYGWCGETWDDVESWKRDQAQMAKAARDANVRNISADLAPSQQT